MADPDHAPQDPAHPPTPSRAHFTREEAAAVLSRYPIGQVRSVRPLALGSSRAPKAHIVADAGEFLLKRRAPGKDNPARVAFAHGLQLHLAAAGFPVAPLVAALGDHNSMVHLQGHTYELFRFIHGSRYDLSIPQTAECGASLARLHALGQNYSPQWPPPPGSYHNSPAIAGQLRAIPDRIGGGGRPLTDKLVSTYARSASTVERMGLSRWPTQAVHGDWHPGNLVFEQGRIIAVLDFDASRIAPRVIDLANGALQFSMTLHATSPVDWPVGLDLDRLRAFLRAYDRAEGATLSPPELGAIPWLMIEALIAEAAPPIAATGRFANLDGHEFLLMVARQAAWIESRAQEIAAEPG
jgi:Ser/Thr protein kinase RdoA (MazF antagonist)